jgi:hypothetical protein
VVMDPFGERVTETRSGYNLLQPIEAGRGLSLHIYKLRAYVAAQLAVLG